MSKGKNSISKVNHYHQSLYNLVNSNTNSLTEEFADFFDGKINEIDYLKRVSKASESTSQDSGSNIRYKDLYESVKHNCVNPLFDIFADYYDGKTDHIEFSSKLEIDLRESSCVGLNQTPSDDI